MLLEWESAQNLPTRVPRAYPADAAHGGAGPVARAVAGAAGPGAARTAGTSPKLAQARQEGAAAVQKCRRRPQLLRLLGRRVVHAVCHRVSSWEMFSYGSAPPPQAKKEEGQPGFVPLAERPPASFLPGLIADFSDTLFTIATPTGTGDCRPSDVFPLMILRQCAMGFPAAASR